MFNTTIVIIEDNVEILELYTELLSDIKNSILKTFKDPREGLAYVIKNKPDIVLTDNMMPHMDGLHVGKKIREVYNPKIILASAIGIKMVSDNQTPHFDEYLRKPFELFVLTDIINLMIDDINRKKIAILNKVTSGMLEGINCVGKDRLFIESIVQTLMYDTDRPQEDSMYAILSRELEKDPSTIRRNINRVVENTYEPTLFQKIMGINKKPKNKEFIDTLLQRINEKAKNEKW